MKGKLIFLLMEEIEKNPDDIPEFDICKNNNIKMVFDVGGDKIQSSSDLTKQFKTIKS